MEDFYQQKYTLIRKLKAQVISDRNKRNLDLALDDLNSLIVQGVEFPDAITLILNQYDVNQYELTQAYDEQ
jgi:hypothetical protein